MSMGQTANENSGFSYKKLMHFALEETNPHTSLVPSPLQEKYSSLLAMDDKTELQMLSFEAPKVRLLRSLGAKLLELKRNIKHLNFREELGVEIPSKHHRFLSNQILQKMHAGIICHICLMVLSTTQWFQLSMVSFSSRGTTQLTPEIDKNMFHKSDATELCNSEWFCF
ncbi:hypothetical protein FXO37_12972 [Capsicum annuum]|nr:hypothetical protein FXO37_12972 [Capsicum annuum]